MPADGILDRLRELRAADAPTHGGRVLAYVYDPGREELDELAAAAAREMQPVNGLDPTTFTSVAVLEREVVGFVRTLLGGGGGGGGGDDVVGSVTSGGTESCLLAVKTARDVWRASADSEAFARPRVVAPATVHAAFHKAAALFGLTLDLVPVDATAGAPTAAAMIERIGPDVALVVVSAPSYPFATLDPIGEVAGACAAAEVACHVDACIGGLILPFWRTADGAPLPAWDLRVPGVTSISADLHKYGYAPKGVSVLLQRGRDRQRAQYFATTSWPGYPVVNPTLLGSKPAGPLAASWAIIQRLGVDGFAELAASCLRSTRRIRQTIEQIEGLRVVGDPVGPLIAVTTDETVPVERRVDAHHWGDQAREHGWILQLQPPLAQADGVLLPGTTHLTITPVTERGLDELCAALVAAADEVRGVPPLAAEDVLAGLPGDVLAALPGGPGSAASGGTAGVPNAEAAFALLQALGLVGAAEDGHADASSGADARLPDRLAPFMALIGALPHPLTERLLTELLARVVEPR